MIEIDQIAQEMDDSIDQDWIGTAESLTKWSTRIRSLSASHRLLSVPDIEQALKLFNASTCKCARCAKARTLLGLPPTQEKV